MISKDVGRILEGNLIAMSETLTFHFEGALADSHKMNFYESARFQYAAARLMVKLAQFRRSGKFSKNITSKSNFDIKLISQSDGSFNINVEDPGQESSQGNFINISLSDLIAYVGERVIEKIDEVAIASANVPNDGGQAVDGGFSSEPMSVLDQLVAEVAANGALIFNQPPQVQELIRRRTAEIEREARLADSGAMIAQIDSAQSQKLIAMSAPLMNEMATALRTSADTLEVRSSNAGQTRSVLFLDRKMAEDIETAVVDKNPIAILGDITQFNKDNGWGKLKIEGGAKIVGFNIPYDVLPSIKQTLIDNMKRDMVYLKAYFVRDRAGEVVRLIVDGILPTPTRV